jgi:gas vesicle protein
MSGRWVEQSTPFACIIDLFEGIENLSGKGFQLLNIPEDLKTLRRIEQKIADMSRKIEETLYSLDTEAIDIASNILDSSDTTLSEHKTQMEMLSSQTAANLENLQKQYSEYQIEETKFEQTLNRLSKVNSVNIKTPHGQKSLELKHGRYRYRHWVEDYQGGEDTRWLNTLSSSYSEVGEKRRKELKKSRESTSSEMNRVKISLQSRVANAKEASSKAANEELRRKRDKEVMSIAKKGGFIVNRKKVGKKVQYALLRRS